MPASLPYFSPRLIGAALALGAMVSLTSPAMAQSSTLEAQRQAVFAQLINAPADRTLMLQYARLSVQLRDFEAAAATLERYVDLHPGDAGARIELAVAYFALGSYDVAEYHLAAAANSGALTPEQTARVAAYRDEGQSRNSGSHIDARIAIGTAWTNSSDQSGTFGSAELEWRLDLGDANATQWVTEFAYTAFFPGENAFNDRQVARLRSGPEFRLTGDAYGPRLQPYVELGTFRDTFGFGDFDFVSLGFAYQNTHNARFSSFADVQFGQARASNFGNDFDFWDANAGIIYRPSRATRIRGSLRWRVEDNGFQETEQNGIRVEVQHDLNLFGDSLFGDSLFGDSILGGSGTPRPLEVSGYIDLSQAETNFGFFDNEISTHIVGGSVRAFVTDNVFIEGRAAFIEQEQFGFTSDERVYALQVGWEF